MNRNNLALHIALAVVLILVAAFAGQLRKWQKHWRSTVHIMPTESKSRDAWDQDGIARDNGPSQETTVLVRFRSGISQATIRTIATRLHDQIEDQIESVPGLEAIDDLDNESAEAVASEYRKLPEVEYAEPNYQISLDHAGGGFK